MINLSLLMLLKESIGKSFTRMDERKANLIIKQLLLSKQSHY